MLQNMPHPHVNPTAGEKISFRKTYTPPVVGKTAESSAQTSAPQKVSPPAASQTSSTPPAFGTSRVISEGCMKMDAPRMIPTTIAVEWARVMDWRRF
jgi:hypothetical protein